MKKTLTNNLGLKLLAFFTAVMLWIIVVNIDDPYAKKTFTNIPVTVINTEVLAEEQQTFQIMDNTQTVSVIVNAKRSVLNKIKAEDIVAVADMKELTLKTQIPIDVTIEKYSGKYESAVATPRNLQVKLEEEEIKKFPIVPTTTGTVRDGYVLGEIKAVPEKVSIRGPKSVIEKISKVGTSVNISGLSKDTVLSSELVLYDEDGEIIDQTLLTNNLGADGVGVKVSLLHTKEVPIEFDTSEISAASGYEFTEITFEPQKVSVAGKEEDLESVTSINIPASVLRMNELMKKTEKVVKIAEYLPENIQLTDENADSIVVTISIEKNGTKSYEVTVGNIKVKNLNEDFVLTLETADSIELLVRGTKELLDAYEPEGHVSIDLQSYDKAGTYTVKVKVDVPNGCILEREPTVNITLEKKDD